MQFYSIVRYRFGKSKQTLRTGQTLEQAQAWCQLPDTKGNGWFDGYERE
jgi:hypothetical protein